MKDGDWDAVNNVIAIITKVVHLMIIFIIISIDSQNYKKK